MFTGIIQDVGTISAIRREPEQTHIVFKTKLAMGNWALGDSVACNGCCLTITQFPANDAFAATLSQETLNLTIFSAAHEGDAVNLEPALRMGDALGGHMVTGHVDGVGLVKSVKAIGEHREYAFSLPEKLARYVVVKGSVAINGVSLTVNRVDGCDFTVNLIPHTLSHTNLGALKAGDRVNIETDMYGRYVERLMHFPTENS
ncbi:riboflavin synthase alpha chain [Mariprofundus ferrinatatus]|uniref:Riboflavin synthase n=1 Tax=Mariprofundus ferrinatatus TaxID=1921087 RepID=A0A2K8L4Q5_9PROT|nr:riboflavin synthase [Mariprofundus ferrinatatus]ATX82267.1 riboflavin synthase alpha chain [Mariprofundus ferrinatatus]